MSLDDGFQRLISLGNLLEMQMWGTQPQTWYVLVYGVGVGGGRWGSAVCALMSPLGDSGAWADSATIASLG